MPKSHLKNIFARIKSRWDLFPFSTNVIQDCPNRNNIRNNVKLGIENLETRWVPTGFPGTEVLSGGTAVSIQAMVNSSFTTNVANFTDNVNIRVAGDFSANINWGDGSQSAGTIVQNPDGSFEVSGSHTYSSSGLEYVRTTVSEIGPPASEGGGIPANLNVTNVATISPVGISGTGGSGSPSQPTPTPTPIPPPSPPSIESEGIRATFTPQGNLDVLYVNSQHQLFEIFNGKTMLLGGGVLSASLAYGPEGKVMDVIYTTNVLVQFDSEGIHVLGGNFISVNTSFDPNGKQVYELVDTSNNLYQIDELGSHHVTSNVLNASVAYITGKEVSDITFTDHNAYQVSPLGTNYLGSGISAASTTSDGYYQVTVIAYQNGQVSIQKL